MVDVTKLEFKTYKYRELCQLFNEQPRTAKHTKDAHLKEWRRYFNWISITTQKYLVTEIYDCPKPKSSNHGGARDGSGRKTVLQDEFEYLFNAYLCQEVNRNLYNGNPTFEVRFTNSQIMKYFGMIGDNFYDAKGDEKVDIRTYNAIYEKILSNKTTWIINKMERMYNVELSYGLIGYKHDGGKKVVEYPDGKLSAYNELQKEYLESTKQHIYHVIQNDKWNEMTEYISNDDAFCNYDSVSKCRSILFNIDTLMDYELDEVEKCRKVFNQYNIQSITSYFTKRSDAFNIADVRYITENYVAI